MNVFKEVAVLGQGEDPIPELLLDQIAAWVRSAPMQSLISRSGGTLAATGLTEQLAYLDEFTQSWNFRHSVSDGPRERGRVDGDAVSVADEDLVIAAADALGLVRPRAPKYRHYDHVLTLGGLVTANRWRTAYTAHLLNNGISADNIAAITAYRRLALAAASRPMDEFTLLDTFGLPRREFEWEVMEDCLCLAFGISGFTVQHESDPSTGEGQRFRVASATAAGRKVSLIAAPALKAGRLRADTSDGYRFWASQVQQMQPGERILAVTTCIYVPYQHAVALQHLALPFGCTVDTVGINFSAIGDDPDPLRFRGAHYLTEIRSALLAYRRVVTQMSGNGTNPGH